LKITDDSGNTTLEGYQYDTDWDMAAVFPGYKVIFVLYVGHL
jgi:hypothetical protein